MSMGARRHRITLMREDLTEGAGGRLQRSRPIIADVWAEASLSAGVTPGQTGGRVREEKASFTMGYHHAYLKARFIAWDGKTFHVTAYSLTGTSNRLISFDAARLHENEGASA